MHIRFLVLLVSVLTFSCSTKIKEPLSSRELASKTTQNFVYFARDRERITDKGFLAAESLVGALVWLVHGCPADA